MEIKKMIQTMVEQDASDLFLRASGLPRLRLNGRLQPLGDKTAGAEDLQKAVEAITTPAQREVFKSNLDVDFALFLPEFNRRFRISIFLQQGLPSIVVRNIRNVTQTFEELNLPAEALKKLCLETRGLILLTGSMGSGKSTTIASMIDYINANTARHILTIEEPIEFSFTDKKSLINQRELGLDVSSYPTALRALTLQSPDVIYIANIRDAETMSAAMTAAETGVLVLSTLHTINASKSVERMVNFFSPHHHQEVRNQLSTLLKGVISLRLVQMKEAAGRIPAYEVMLQTATISRLIREGNIWDIPGFIEDGAVYGMCSFTQSLIRLVREGKISEEEAMDFSDNRDEFSLALKGIKKT